MILWMGSAGPGAELALVLSMLREDGSPPLGSSLAAR